VFVSSETYRIFLDDSYLILLKIAELSVHENNFLLSPERDKILIQIAVDQ